MEKKIKKIDEVESKPAADKTARADTIIITGTGHRHTVRAGETIPEHLRAAVAGGGGRG